MKPRVLLAVDRQGWSFFNIAQQLVAHLSDEYRFHIVDTGQKLAGECDVIVVFWWGDLANIVSNPDLKCGRIVLAIYDHLSWNRTEGDRDALRWAIDRADVVTVCNAEMGHELTTASFNVSTPIMLAQDGVDTTLFQPSPLPETFKVGWCGNSAVGYGTVKGLDLISEACHRAGVELAVMDFANCGGLHHFCMPSWYRGISAYVCASSADGTPNPPLEAMACGRPVISTRCGIMPQLIQNGYNGYLAQREPTALAAAIDRLRRSDLERMSRAARTTAIDWDWSKKAQAWRRIFDTALEDRTKPTAPAVLKDRPRGLLVADVRGWAFDINEQDMDEYCSDEFDFDHYILVDKAPPPWMGKYRFSFLPYHRWCLDHYWVGAPYLGSLRSQWFDPASPEKVNPQDSAFVRRSHGFHVCYGHAYAGLKRRFPQVVYLTNPVNTRKFQRATEVGGIVCEWNGNAAHGQEDALNDVKGIHHVIKPAVDAAGVELVTREFSERIPHDEMTDFYCQANVALCASKYEGASNSVMEAMASGLAVVATDVGNHSEMQASQLEHLGDTGIMLVDRAPEAFTEAIKRLTPQRVKEMGEINRREIFDRWSWDAWSDRYHEFFRMAL